MKWVDVFGSPGVGKSTMCDPIWGHREIGWDGKLPPANWEAFLNEITNLFYLIREHPSFEAALRMNNRSIKKMATVARMPDDETRPAYVQTGFIQRGLGFAWRLNQMGADINLVRPFFELMPVSVGAVYLTAPLETIIERNHKRKLNPETAHEDRAWQAELYVPCVPVALEVLRARGVPILDIDTTDDVDRGRDTIRAFAAQEPFDASEGGCRSQVEVLHAPPWFQQ